MEAKSGEVNVRCYEKSRAVDKKNSGEPEKMSIVTMHKNRAQTR